MRPREGYYAALERQRAGESTLKDRINKRDREKDVDAEFEALETIYTEVGMKAFTAFNSLLDWLAAAGQRGISPAELDRPIREAVSQGLEQIQEEIQAIAERIARMEGSIAAIEAGMRRIDKFTMEAFRNLQEMEERLDERSQQAPSAGAQALRGRLAKEEAAGLALSAAMKMRAEGRRLTLASVAREAGLKYGQIVYAFGNKEGFFRALAENQQGSAEKAGAGYEETATA